MISDCILTFLGLLALLNAASVKGSLCKRQPQLKAVSVIIRAASVIIKAASVISKIVTL